MLFFTKLYNIVPNFPKVLTKIGCWNIILSKAEMCMIKIIANWILNLVCKNCDIPNDLREAYQYGIGITISSIFNILLILLTSLLFRDVLSGVIFLLCFISLRTYSGGYHATTYLRCSIVFLLTYILVEISHIFLSHYFLSNIRFSEVLL